jgi:hypothetical protein
MLAGGPTFPFALDLATLLINGGCLAVLLGLLLLLAARQERLRAAAWWGAAYLLGGFSVAVWSMEKLLSPPLPYGAANALLFLACGMIWSGARIFHGRAVLWGAMAAGAATWLGACALAGLGQSAENRIVLSSIIVSVYAFLTAVELWRERRKSVLQRWWAVFVPVLHGCVFLIPISLAMLMPAAGHTIGLTSVWAAVFALEGYPLNATVSVGGAAAVAATSIDALVAAADQALYRAKANGRNRVECIEGQPPNLPGTHAGLRIDGCPRLLPAARPFLPQAQTSEPAFGR